MEGQMDLFEYLESQLEFDILDYIPVGSDKAIKRRDLADITGLKDREMRLYIHLARRKIPIINLSSGRGYFIPDMNTEKDRKLLLRWVRQEESRLMSIGWALKAARQTLRNCGIDWRTYGKDEPGKGQDRRTRAGENSA